jgi:general secretion pathway protein F
VDRQYSYRAVDREGRTQLGRVWAFDVPHAARNLLAQGLTPLRIELSSPSLEARHSVLGSRPSRRDMQVLLEELSTLLGAGVPLAEVLSSLARSYARHPLGPVLARADQKVRAGASLSTALDDVSLQWPSYVLALMRASEASGEMAPSLRQGADQMAQDIEAAQEFRSALLYPSVLVVAGIFAVLIIFVGVIPRFAGLLKGSRAQIPEFSRTIIELGVFLQQHLLGLAWCLALVVALVYWCLHQPILRKRALAVCVRLPLIGSWLRSIDIGRWALVLGTLLSSRVPMLDALRLASEPLLVEQVRKGLVNASKAVQQGGMLSDQLEGKDWFPAVRVNLLRVGERAGDLPRMLRSLGEIETQQARILQRRLLGLLEPFAILLIGTVIAVIMISVMMAVSSLNQVAL